MAGGWFSPKHEPFIPDFQSLSKVTYLSREKGHVSFFFLLIISIYIQPS